MTTIARKPAAMTAVHDAGHISWVDMERQQTPGINGDVQTLSWEGWLQKRLSYTISQLMSTEGFNNINSLRLTTSWGCKSNGASFHLHLHSCSSEQGMGTGRGVLEQSLFLLHGFLFCWADCSSRRSFLLVLHIVCL